MSIRRSCRSRAVETEAGQALIMALVILLFALPVGITFYKFVNQTLKSAIQERRQKDAAQIANDALTDYMRQFSQDVYNGHYDLDALSHPEAFYSAGYSTVSFIPDSVNRTLYINAHGIYGTTANPLTTKGVEALIQFSSDLTQFGTMFNGTASLGYSNIVYDGGFYVNGNFTETGSNVRFRGGPVMVRGNFSGTATTVVDGDAFVSGTLSGATVNGTRYTYVPNVTWPTLDFKYYDAHYTYKTTATKDIIFYSTGTFREVGGASYTIPASGAIVYCDNCNLRIKGIIAGRVTVVAGADAAGNCSSTAGKITFNDSLYYAGASSITASATNSFSALGRNCIAWNKASGNILTVGVNFVQQGTSNMVCEGSSPGKQWIYGTRTQVITGSGFSGGTAIVYDANLRAYPPPGLPEKALLVNWKLH